MRAWIYDRVFRWLTTRWYRAVIDHLDPGSHILDVGIGPGGSLINNVAYLRAKNLRLTGVDIDRDYLKTCRKRIDKLQLTDVVDVHLESVLDHHGGPYDAVYFAASFMLIPEQIPVLEHVATLLKPSGRIFFTQTFNEKRSRVAEWVKPRIHKVTTVHFGQVTYYDEFRDVLTKGGMKVIGAQELNRLGKQVAELVIAIPQDKNGGKPAPAAAESTLVA